MRELFGKMESTLDGIESLPHENIKNMEFSIGQKVFAKMKDGNIHEAEILLSRIKDGKENYLIHFTETNRRLDVWLFGSQLLTEYTKPIEDNNIINDQHTKGSFNLRRKAHSVIDSECGLKQPTVLQSRDGVEIKMTRQRKRRYNEINHISTTYENMDATTAALEKAYDEFTKIKYIEKIEFGVYLIDAWYFSPYPDEYRKVPMLYICEFCLCYMVNNRDYTNHMINCRFRLTDMIYHKEILKMFQVDGTKQKLFCQNLCLLAKLFLDHKTLYYDVSHFYFYILMETDEYGDHIVGYFSKEKHSNEGFNLSCIMILPPHQRKGYGKFLISMSYELSAIEGKIGTPEKPLSDLGKLSYRSYWSWVLLMYLKRTKCETITVEELSYKTGIKIDDIVYTLQILNLLKYWKGQYVICATPKVIDEFLNTGNLKPPLVLTDPGYLNWIPPK